MARFTLKQLSYFIAAGEANSITLASERVHISQPSISAAISRLETEFGVQLFFRHHAQGLSLTTAGERMLCAARELLQRAEALQDLAGEITSVVSGRLRVGAFRTLAPLILPELCAEFSADHPGVTLEMFEYDEAELVAKVRKSELDIALTYEQTGIEIQFEQIASLSTYALLADSSPLAIKDAISLRDLAGEPFILLDLPVSKEYFFSLFRKLHLEPNIVARSEQPEMVRSFVGAGLGYSLLTARPKSLVALNGMPLAYIPLNDDIPPMKLGIITATNIRKTRIISAFEDHCRNRINSKAIPGMTSL